MKGRKRFLAFASAVLLLAAGLITVTLAVGLHLLQTPQLIGKAIGKRGPGDNMVANGSTVRTVSLLDSDEYAYRLECYDRDKERVFKKDIPIPDEIWRGNEVAGYRQLRSIEEVTFSGNGKIVWSANGSQVAFLVHEIEIFRHVIR